MDTIIRLLEVTETLPEVRHMMYIDDAGASAFVPPPPPPHTRITRAAVPPHVVEQVRTVLHALQVLDMCADAVTSGGVSDASVRDGPVFIASARVEGAMAAMGIVGDEKKNVKSVLTRFMALSVYVRDAVLTRMHAWSRVVSNEAQAAYVAAKDAFDADPCPDNATAVASRRITDREVSAVYARVRGLRADTIRNFVVFLQYDSIGGADIARAARERSYMVRARVLAFMPQARAAALPVSDSSTITGDVDECWPYYAGAQAAAGADASQIGDLHPADFLN